MTPLQLVDAERPASSLSDSDAARRLADFHREVAAELPPTSRMRGAALRCAAHWARIAGQDPVASLSVPEVPS